MLRNFFFLLLAAAAGFAQDGANPFDRPPADVDKALRAHISEFFQCHITGEYRKAEALVAEDTKDLYYNGNKPKYYSFEILRIDYSENYTKAKATVLAEMLINAPGFDRPHKFPIPSYWKMENGEWRWYVDQSQLLDTPFGRRKETDLKGLQGPIPSALNIPTTIDFAMNKVKPDKSSVALKRGESAEVSFSNNATGFVGVALYTPIPGLEVSPARVDVKPGGKASFTLKVAAGANVSTEAPASVTFKVEQTGELIPVEVKISQ
jgi:hypothetical protein